jgi:MFS family permease
MQSEKPSISRNIALGVAEIFLWGGSYFLMAVIADPVVASTQWPRAWVVGALSIAILISGLLAPFVGRRIRELGGRRVLVTGAVILAMGLAGVAASPDLPLFLIAWVIVGIGMSATLYDALFSIVGQTYGQGARGSITQITLISGLAITVCWPISNFLVQMIGWRGACLGYSVLVVVLVIPLFLWAIPAAVGVGGARLLTEARPPHNARTVGLFRLGASFTVASMIMTAISVELLMLLELKGLSTAQAVALGALIGPAQVFTRAIEGLLGRGTHPYWNLLIGSVAAFSGLILLATAPSLAWLAIILYGIGNGMRTIVRGTLPLALYGRDEYATVMGQLARAPLIGQAATPLAAGLLVQYFGSSVLLPALLILGLANVALAAFVYPLTGLKNARSNNRGNPGDHLLDQPRTTAGSRPAIPQFTGLSDDPLPHHPQTGFEIISAEPQMANTDRTSTAAHPVGRG